QWTVVRPLPSPFVTVSEVSQPVAGVVDEVPVVLSQLIVADVAPDPPSRKLTWKSESGVSAKLTVEPPKGESLHFALAFTGMDCPAVVSIAYPFGAAVSVTVYVPNGRLSTQTVPLLPVVTLLEKLLGPVIENVAPASGALVLVEVFVILIAPSCCLLT